MSSPINTAWYFLKEESEAERTRRAAERLFGREGELKKPDWEKVTGVKQEEPSPTPIQGHKGNMQDVVDAPPESAGDNVFGILGNNSSKKGRVFGDPKDEEAYLRDMETFDDKMDEMVDMHGMPTAIAGGHTGMGPAHLAEMWADNNGIPYIDHKPDFDLHGRYEAGGASNANVVTDSHRILAFPRRGYQLDESGQPIRNADGLLREHTDPVTEHWLPYANAQAHIESVHQHYIDDDAEKPLMHVTGETAESQGVESGETWLTDISPFAESDKFASEPMDLAWRLLKELTATLMS